MTGLRRIMGLIATTVPWLTGSGPAQQTGAAVSSPLYCRHSLRSVFRLIDLHYNAGIARIKMIPEPRI